MNTADLDETEFIVHCLKAIYVRAVYSPEIFLSDFEVGNQERIFIGLFDYRVFKVLGLA